jgi:hypothetical protein
LKFKVGEREIGEGIEKEKRERERKRRKSKSCVETADHSLWGLGKFSGSSNLAVEQSSVSLISVH